MPMKWVPPGVFLVLPDGSKVYHAYRQENYNDPWLSHYSLYNEKTGEFDEFDVREIPYHRHEKQSNTPGDSETMARVRLLGWAMDCWVHHVSLAELIFEDTVTYEMVTERV